MFKGLNLHSSCKPNYIGSQFFSWKRYLFWAFRLSHTDNTEGLSYSTNFLRGSRPTISQLFKAWQLWSDQYRDVCRSMIHSNCGAPMCMLFIRELTLRNVESTRPTWSNQSRLSSKSTRSMALVNCGPRTSASSTFTFALCNDSPPSISVHRSMVHSDYVVQPKQSGKWSLDSSLILVVDLPFPTRLTTWVDCGPWTSMSANFTFGICNDSPLSDS